MTNELKTYSVLIAWQDNDPEQGEWGGIVRAHSAAEAEIKARQQMFEECGDEHDDIDTWEDIGGRVIETNVGMIWHADLLEDALRDILTAANAARPMAFPIGLENALTNARELLDRMTPADE